MAVPYERLVAEDLNQGYGTVSVSMPAGGSASGSKIGIHTLLPLVYNVIDFGAVADGVVDNASAFAAVAVVANASTVPVTVYFPPGTYRYSSGLAFTSEVTLTGASGAILDYTGVGKAVSFGPDGLDLTTYLDHLHYSVEGLTFTGGSTMSHGIYWNSYLTTPRMRHVTFNNFGNATAYAVYFQSNNWDIEVSHCYAFDDSVVNVARNFLRVRGYSAGGVADNGNSRLRMIGCRLSHQAVAVGVGVWANGAVSEISHCTIEGYGPAVRLSAWANVSRVVNNYFETAQTTIAACIEYGDPAGGDLPSNFLANLTVRDNYCNLHNTDFGTTAYFMAPSSVNTGLQRSDVSGNIVTGATTGREFVNQNNKLSQIGNRGVGNRLFLSSDDPVLHTNAANITRWVGDQGVIETFNTIDGTDAYYALRGGRTARQNTGIQFENYDGTVLTRIYSNPGSSLVIENNGLIPATIDGSGRLSLAYALFLKNGNGFPLDEFTALAAIAVQVVHNIAVTANAVVLVMPVNAAASALVRVHGLYVGAIIAGASFELKTDDGTNFVGTEVFRYLLVNWP